MPKTLENVSRIGGFEKPKFSRGTEFFLGTTAAEKKLAREEEEEKKRLGLETIKNIKAATEKTRSPQAQKARDVLQQIEDLKILKAQKRGAGDEEGALEIPAIQLEQSLQDTTTMARQTPETVLAKYREEAFEKGITDDPGLMAYINEQTRKQGVAKATADTETTRAQMDTLITQLEKNPEYEVLTKVLSAINKSEDIEKYTDILKAVEEGGKGEISTTQDIEKEVQKQKYETGERVATQIYDTSERIEKDKAAKERAGIMANMRQQAVDYKRDSKLESRPLPATQAVELAQTRTSIGQLDSMISSAGKVDLQFGPTDIIRGFNPWDTSAKGMKQLVYTTKQIIGKGLEGGVLRKEDEKKYDKIIPRLGDTRAVLQIKYIQLRRDLKAKYDGIRLGLEWAGYSVGEFQDIQEEDIDITRKKEPPPGQKKAPPAIGTVKNGFKFLGGDPSKKENWEKI